MKRYSTTKWNETLKSISCIPKTILNIAGPFNLFVGSDSVFAGLTLEEKTEDGRSYHNTPHVLYPFHLEHRPLLERISTIVLPNNSDYIFPEVVIHEFGHILDYALGFQRNVISWQEFAKTNREEAFSMSFTAWMCKDKNLYKYDYDTVLFFNALENKF